MNFPRFTSGRWLLLAAAAVLAWSPPAVAQVDGFDLWEEISEQQAAGRLPAALKSTATREIVPQAYRTLVLNKASMSQLLAAAPAESPDRSPDAGAEIILPLPQGGYGRFSVLDSPIMEPALAAQFPEIKSYIVQGIDDPTATGRLDTSPKGFRAMVIGAGGTFFIDPYWSNSDDVSICYAKKDFTNEDKLKEWSCGVVGSGSEVAKAARSEKTAARPTGATLRIYRAAIAATGEYTAVHGGTVAGGLAAINTSLNRINTVYERDFCLRMVLVANNNLLVYTNGASDPYTNGTPGSMINQNQTNIDNVIGSANYDIGHVYGTAVNSGLAGLGVVCVNGQKARGVTCSTAPVGDPFDIDYVAHEMGHQFNAEHTFNASGNGNINPPTAFEPGSGSTIMSYVGIIAGQNLQALANDYFHTGSYTEIDTYITTGAGRFAFLTNATGNAPPVIGALFNYTIPSRTPFALIASATDANGDALTYCWEEYDIGAAQNPVTANPRDNGASPIFRSYTGTTNPTRLFPSLQYILNNANIPPPTYSSNSATWATGEAIPTTSRTMTYRVSVRDNRAGGGGQNWASTQVTTSSSTGPFRLSSQNTATTLTPGTPFNVTWDVAGTTAAPISTANVKISLSTNGGTNFPIVLAESVPNNGSASVTIPGGTSATAARLKVEAVGNIFFDINDANLTVQNADAPIGIPLAPGQNYTENFDIGSAAAASLPPSWRVDKSTVVRAPSSYAAAFTATERSGGINLSSTAGNGIYNFGVAETGRAIGGLSSASASKSVNVYTAIANTGSDTINSFRISFNAQRFRNGSNPSGFSLQLYYSSDGLSWISAGSSFAADFAPNVDNNGAATVPIEVIPISDQILNVPLAGGQTLYLGWNYSVKTGTTTSSAQALGVANVSITAGASGPASPIISSFSPTVGPVGTAVTINGVNFGASPVVKFSGVTATASSVNPGGTVITATVPAGATTGRITVEVSGQPLATSAADFTVGAAVPSVTATPPSITGLSATQGAASTSASYNLVGSNLTGNVVVAPSNPAFEVSTDNTNFGPSVTLTQSGGNVSATIHVRLAATAPLGVASGSINNTMTDGGATLASTPTLAGNVSGGGGGGDGLVAGWDFQTTTTGGTALAASPNTPKVLVANFGSGTLYVDGSNGSSDWVQATELSAFGGTTVNTAGTDFSTVTGGAAALALVNQTANGKRAVFLFSMVGYQNLSISLAAQRTSTGFTDQVWEYSADGSTWSSIGALTSGSTAGTIASAFNTSGVLTLPTFAGLDNAANAYVRVTFNGATAASGNNRIDNIKFTAEQASGPRINVNPPSITTLSATSGTPGVGLPFSVSGQELTGNLTVTAPTNFEVSTTSPTAGFGPTATITASGTLAATEVWVRIASSATQGPIGPVNVRITGGGAAERTVAVSGTVAPGPAGPTINVSTDALSGFLTQQGTASTNQTVTVSGTLLEGPITVAAPASYEVSTNALTGFADSVVLTPVAPSSAPVVFNSSTTINDEIGDIAAGISTGGGTLDIVSMEVSNTATDLVFNLTVNGNITSADWGNFAIGIANGKTTGSINGNGWGRPINLDSPIGGMTHWIGSWVNGVGGSQLWTYSPGGGSGTGNNWSGPLALAGYTLTPGAQSVITYTVAQSALGVGAGDTIFFDAYSSGSGGNDTAIDALSNPNVAVTDWNQAYTSSTVTGISSYTIGGGGGGGDVSATTIYVRLRADAAAANVVSGTLAATSPNATPQNVALSGRVAGITVSSTSLEQFVSLDGAASDPQTFTVSAAGLSTTPLVIRAPTGFVVSSDNGATYAGSVSLTPVNGAVASTTITVRMPAGQTVGATPSGDITVESLPASRTVAVSGTVVPPGPTILFTPAGGITGLSTTQGTASSPGSVTVNGFRLTGDLTATAPANFEVSLSADTDFASSVDLEANDEGRVANVLLYVRIADGAPQPSASGNVVISGGDADPVEVPVSGTVLPTPVITLIGTFTPFQTVTGFASDPQTFTVSGTNLIGNITVTAPTGFEAAGPNGVYGPTATLSLTAGAVSATTVSVRVAASASAGDLQGQVTVGSQGAVAVGTAVNAKVLPAPQLAATPSSLSGLEAVQGYPSAAQNFTVSGSNLLQDVLVTAPTNFEISDNGVEWAETIELEPVYGGAPDPNAPPVVVAADNAGNYNDVWTAGANGGTGFGPWAISNNAAAEVFAGDFLGSSTDGGGDIDTGGVSFGLYANPAAAFSNADRNLATPLQPGESLRVQLALNFDNGNKGIDVYTGGAGGTQLFNFNVSGGASVSAGAGLTLNAGPGQPYNYGGAAVLDVTLTYVSPAQLAYSISRTSSDGNQGILFSGTITSATPFGAPDGLRFYNSGTDGGDGTNNLYFNNLQIIAPGGGTGGQLSDTVLQVRIKAGASVGNVAGAIQVTSGTFAPSRQVALSGQVFPAPQLTVSPVTLTGFEAPRGQVSAVQSFNLTGQNLRNPVELVAPRGFEIADNPVGPYETRLQIEPDSPGGSVTQGVLVRLAADAPAGVLTGEIAITTDFARETVAETAVILQGLVYIPSGEVVESFLPPAANGAVRAVTASSGGSFYVGGDFTQLVRSNGSTMVTNSLSRVARLLADGAVDTVFNPAAGPDSTVRALLEVEGGLLAGGNFSAVAGTPRPGLAKLLPDGSLDGSFDAPLAASAKVNVIVPQEDGQILVGGLFTATITSKEEQNGQLTAVTRTLSNLVRLDPSSGQIDPDFRPNPAGEVNALAVQPDGRILVGGSFVVIADSSRARLARLHPDNPSPANSAALLDTTFVTGIGPSGPVQAIAVLADESIVVGGDFSSYNGSGFYLNLLKLGPSGALDPVFNFSGRPQSLTTGGFNGTVSGVHVQPSGNLVLSGAFTKVENRSLQIPFVKSAGRVVGLQPDGGFASAFNPGGVGANSTVLGSATLANGNLVLVGAFTQFNAQPRSRIVVLTGEESSGQRVSYEEWRDLWFTPAEIADPSISGPDAVNGNPSGLSNFMVYALSGGNPRQAGAEIAPVGMPVSLPGAEDQYFTIFSSFNPLAEVNFFFEYTDDLQNPWEVISHEIDLDEGVIFGRAPYPMHAVPRQFLRLRAEPLAVPFP